MLVVIYWFSPKKDLSKDPKVHLNNARLKERLYQIMKEMYNFLLKKSNLTSRIWQKIKRRMDSWHLFNAIFFSFNFYMSKLLLSHYLFSFSLNYYYFSFFFFSFVWWELFGDLSFSWRHSSLLWYASRS